MTCDIKNDFLAKDKSSTQAFATSVAEILRNRGTAYQIEYERLLRLNEEARLVSESAGLALENHSASHGH